MRNSLSLLWKNPKKRRTHAARMRIIPNMIHQVWLLARRAINTDAKIEATNSIAPRLPQTLRRLITSTIGDNWIRNRSASILFNFQ